VSFNAYFAELTRVAVPLGGLLKFGNAFCFEPVSLSVQRSDFVLPSFLRKSEYFLSRFFWLPRNQIEQMRSFSLN
jgi:hypothetical protein